MPGMPPEQMPPQAPEGEGGGMGDVVELAKQVGEGLAKLSDLLNSSEQVGDDDRAQMSGILTQYADLVEKKLGGAPAEEEPIPADMGAVPAMGGMKGVPGGPQSRM